MGYQGQDIQQQPQQLALPAPHATTATDNTPTIQIVSGVRCQEPIMIAHVHDSNQEQQSEYIDIMVDSGAATHVCPPWFAQEFPIQPLSADNGPQLRTATNNEIKLYGLQMGFTCTMQKDNQRSYHSMCVWRTPTNCISFKVGRTRVHTYITFNEEQRLITHQKASAQHSSSNKLQTTDTTDTWRNNSNDCTYNTYNTRSRANSWRKQWFLDLQQWRIFGKSTQDKEEGTFLTIQDMPSSNWQFGELSKDNRQQTWQEQWGLKDNRQQTWQEQWGLWLWRTLSKHIEPATKESSTRTSLDWRNMVQVEARYNSTNYNSSTTKGLMTNQQRTSRVTQALQADKKHPRRQQHLHRHIVLQQRHQQAHSWYQQANQHPYQHHPQWTGMKITGIQEGHMWKRVHIQPRNELYIPQQTQHGPDITKLKPERVTSWIHKMEQGWQGLMINGQHKNEEWQTRHGQDQQTLKR